MGGNYTQLNMNLYSLGGKEEDYYDIYKDNEPNQESKEFNDNINQKSNPHFHTDPQTNYNLLQGGNIQLIIILR